MTHFSSSGPSYLFFWLLFRHLSPSEFYHDGTARDESLLKIKPEGKRRKRESEKDREQRKEICKTIIKTTPPRPALNRKKNSYSIESLEGFYP